MAKILLLFIISVILTGQVLAQDSKSGYTGDWTSGGTWVGGISPGTVNITGTVNINGFVNAPTISFDNNGELNITDNNTLIVDGDLTMNGTATIEVQNGAVLVIIGDFTALSTLTILNTGVVVITGTTDVASNTSIFGAGKLYLLDGHNLINDNIKDGTIASNVGDAGDLNNDETDLVTFLDTNYGTTLPVELLYFNATSANHQILIRWKTATETNNDYFIIERAHNDQQFSEIARVAGQGTVSIPIEYQIEDNNPLPGQLYYRLKQVDFDGSQHYHSAIGVQFTNNPSILVFPNPSTDGQFQCRTTEKIELVEYVDIAGALHRGRVSYASGVATISPVIPLIKGYYVVRLQTKQRVHLANLFIH